MKEYQVSMHASNDTTIDCKRKGVLIISGFTCIGKSYFCNNINAEKHHGFGEVVDLDSSKYDRDRFPENYMEGIRRRADNLASKEGIILISTHPGVASQLKQDGYYVAQIYPEKCLQTKSEWLQRLELREEKSKESRLYKMVDQDWGKWCLDMEVVTRRRNIFYRQGNI